MSLAEEGVSVPGVRARAGLAARGAQLFLYGGQLERGAVEVTLSDFYQLGELSEDASRSSRQNHGVSGVCEL